MRTAAVWRLDAEHANPDRWGGLVHPWRTGARAPRHSVDLSGRPDCSEPALRRGFRRMLAGGMIARLVIVLLAVGAVAWVAAMFVGHGMWLSAIIVVAAVVAARIAVPTSR
jgi:hypothetical protein